MGSMKYDYIKQLISITVIKSSGFHCNFNFYHSSRIQGICLIKPIFYRSTSKDLFLLISYYEYVQIHLNFKNFKAVFYRKFSKLSSPKRL